MADIPKNIKLLISDYDGTLANPSHNISPKNVEAIKRWEESGRYFTIASGRMYAMIKEKAEVVNLKTFVISRGGAEIIDSENDKVLFQKTIDKTTVEKFLDYILENGLEVAVEKDNDLYSDFYNASKFKLLNAYPLKDFKIQDIPKMVIYAVNGDIEEKVKFVNSILKKEFPMLHIAQINSPDVWKVWDVTSLDATKHLATLEMLKMLDIKPEEACAIGDGDNDFPMLSAVGFKVAVDNAVDDLKEIADMVVPNKDFTGVAHLIDKLLK